MRGMPARSGRALSCFVVALVAVLVAPAAAEVPISGEAAPGLEILDQPLAGLVEQYGIPGASIAIVKDGRLVYARGFGYANVEKEEPARPTTLFRIASVSKPITATAVMVLVRQGKLHLDDRVAELLDLRAPAEIEMDPRWREVTVRHLLQHRGGWDRQQSGDPMFALGEIRRELQLEGDVAPRDIIQWMLARPLDFEPGERAAYSNFGYCLLGRIIEKASGESYETFIQREVFGALGVSRPRLGRTLAEQAAPGEASYYDPDGREAPANVGPNKGASVPLPYGAWSVEAMDANGGWIASAVDLAKFAAAYQRPDDAPLLTAEDIAAMWAPPEGEAGHRADGRPRDVIYGLGWAVRRAKGGRIVAAWHAGRMNGTAGLLVLRQDGLAWVVLVNSQQTKEGRRELTPLLDPVMHEIVGLVSEWPEDDLFPRYFP